MSGESPSELSFSVGRRWGVGLHVFLSTAAFFALVVMINYLSAGHFKRVHWTIKKDYQLSSLTAHVLQSLTNQVNVVVFFDPNDSIYSHVSALINEYKATTPRLNVRYVNWMIDNPGANAVMAKYKLSQLPDKNLVIFECNGRNRFVFARDLADTDVQPVLNKQQPEFQRRIVAFKGEQLFTAAIFSVVNPRQPKACFLTGYGSLHAPGDEMGINGYGKFASLLKEENNVLWSQITLTGTNQIPADCDLLIIVGPVFPIPPAELDKIDEYLQQGGRLFTLFFSLRRAKPSGLEQLLTRWGVSVGYNEIVDRASTVGSLTYAFQNYGTHAIVKPLYESALEMFAPRTVGRLKGGQQTADAPRVDDLVFTSEKATASTEFDRGEPRRNLTRDARGPFSVIAAVEKGSIRNINIDRGATRMVIAGDSIFLDNEMIGVVPANREFARLAVNWLLDRTQLIEGIGPRPVKSYQLTMTHREMVIARWILLGAMPGVILLLGLLVWWRRRH